MNCSQILSVIAMDCQPNAGGIRRVLLSPDVLSVSIQDYIINGITLPENKYFVEFSFRPNTSNLISEWQTEGDSRYVQSVLEMQFSRMETAKRSAIMALVKSEVYVIVEDRNGKYWYLGYDTPAILTQLAAPTGTARGDNNGYTIGLTDYSRELPYEVDSAIIPALLDPDAPTPPTPDPPTPPVVPDKYVQDLLNEGYASKITGAHGDTISILDTCPYPMAKILDLGEVARNEKQLVAGTKNIIVWNEALPDGWTSEAVAALYAGKELNFTPRGAMLWAVKAIPSLAISFAGGDFIAVDYPWGSYLSEGIFAPRWNASKEQMYEALGFRNTPAAVEVTIRDGFSSVAQVMFTMMKTTRSLALNLGGLFVCHDVTGMFEGCTQLETLTISGSFRWDAIRTCHNMFDGCNALLSIPYVTAWGRDSIYNTIYPRFDGTRGSADCRHLFNAPALTSIGPRLDMNAISLAGCTADDQQQEALSDVLFNCPNLTDVRLVNVGNNSWNFADPNGFVYIPKMDAASIDYLLNNVKTGSGTLTFAALHRSEVSAAAIAVAQGRGWTINFV